MIAGVFAAAPLWDFGIHVEGIFGWNINADGSLTRAGGRIDPTAVALLNGEPNTLDAEKALALAPDLIITVTFQPDDPSQLWGIDPGAASLVSEIAPVIAISGLQRADILVQRFAELAVALGADLATPGLEAQRANYDAANERLRMAVTTTPASALFAFPEPDQVYLANPNTTADVQLFRDLGLRVLPDTDDDSESWVGVSYEEIGAYEADLFFYATGDGAMPFDEIVAHPTLGQMPAVASGHAVPWQQDVVFSFPGVAESLDTVATAVHSLG
ncbi:MAG: ABC transporter substrate-binding protein [Thermomicrobiales bacterium]